jgi:DNA polymerase elongation subunit (family B)
MYQAIYYDFQTYTYHLRDDKQGWMDFQFQPTYWKRVNEWQDGAKPVLTGGWAIPTKKLDKNDPDLLEKDIDKSLYVLRELYYKFDDVVPSWHNIVYIDIEIEMGGALTPEYIRSAPMPLTSIALIDMTTKQKICFIVDKSKQIPETNQDGKIIIPCGSERELIGKFLSKYEELDPTILVGYNSAYFDLPYLYYRMSQVVGTDEVSRLSPIGRVEARDFNGENQVKIGGVNHLDYMLLHKKYIMKEEPSYKLGDIGTKYVGLGKIEYEGNLNTLFKNDLNTFIDYNLRDVEILEKLEDKLKFIELTVMISHICNIPYESIYYNTVMNEGAILKHLRREGIISPNKPTTHNPSRKAANSTYAGGYLLEPIPGLYFDVIDLDFTSLYPSIIKSLNLGIETLVGRIVTLNPTYEQNHSLEKLKERDPNEVVTVEKLNKKNYTLQAAQISIGKLIKLIEDNEFTLSASGAMFRTDEQSVVAKILEGWFDKREHYRGLKKTAGKSEDWANYKLYDLFQHAFKILQNAMYGTFAKNGWRYTDGHLICSAAITNSGQRLTQESIVFANNKLNTELKSDKQFICISDTDSMYIELGDLLKHRYPDSTPDQKDELILKMATEIQDESNHYLNELCKKVFNINPKKHYFQLKQEVIAKGILVTGKRRYAMYITNKEGVAVEELDMKGLELMKSNMNKRFKGFGEQFIKDILFGKAKTEIDQTIIDFYKLVKTLDPRELGKPTGVKQIASYRNAPRAGEMFSTFRLKAPSNTKAAVRYNDLLRFKRLDKQYESVVEGDKIFIINLKANPYKLDTIGLPNAKVPDEIEKFVKTYIDVDEIFESLLLNKLKELYKDLKWEFPPLNANVAKFFAF